MPTEKAGMIPGRVVEPIGRGTTDGTASGVARPCLEHDGQSKAGPPCPDAPVDVFEGKEIRLVQQADPFDCAAMEHEDRARERVHGNHALFIARDLSMGFEPHAAKAQVDTHAA